MKKLFVFLFAPLLLLTVSCEEFEAVSESDVIAGLKEALEVGTNNSVSLANVQDGYFLNNLIKIPFPEEAAIIETTLRSLNLNVLVDELVLKLNRAAEDAADKAGPIFVGAITNMTIQDGWNILRGADNAATEYLRTNTYSDLKEAFKPDIKNSLDAVGASAAWTAVVDQYNRIPFVTPANADLPDYTTGKALDGLFTLIAAEELKIREDPIARITDLLKKVFAEQDN